MTTPRRWRAAATLGSWLLVSACASIAPPGGESLSGRLSVRVDSADATPARQISASFELQGDAQRGSLALDTPLGTTLALARWQPGTVTLSTPQGESAHADLATLTREALGEELPVAALFDWLRGRPWPGAESVPAVPPAPAGFTQLGWNVDLARLADAWVVARRLQAPAVTVRIKLDRP